MLRLLLVGAAAALALAQLPTDCGKTPITPNESPLEALSDVERIVNGEEAKAHSWPWQIQLQRSGSFICGGSLITSRHVLTAAHCVKSGENRPETFKIVVGTHSRSANEPSQVTVNVEKVLVHPDYGNGVSPNDVALLKLDKEVVFNDKVQPVCVPNSDVDVAVEPNSCYVTGWGRTGSSRPTADKLQQVHLPFVNRDSCRRSFGSIIDETMVCAGQSDKGGCFGDSGGPLTVKVGDLYHLYGVVSFGSSSCSGRPTVFARVAHFHDLIVEAIKL